MRQLEEVENGCWEDELSIEQCPIHRLRTVRKSKTLKFEFHRERFDAAIWPNSFSILLTKAPKLKYTDIRQIARFRTNVLRLTFIAKYFAFLDLDDFLFIGRVHVVCDFVVLWRHSAGLNGRRHSGYWWIYCGLCTGARFRHGRKLRVTARMPG